MMLRLQSLICISCMTLLFSCGGGGGSNHNNSVTNLPASSTSNLSASAISSSPSSITSSQANQALAAPQSPSAVAGNGSITLNWNNVAGATGYHIYYATDANIQAKNISAFHNGTWIQNVSAPYTVTGLQNNMMYYFVITAINGSGESAQSVEVNAIPTADDSTKQLTAQEVLVIELINRARFDPAAEAARYNIGLNDGITGTTISSARKSPLAPNLLLTDAARIHSQWMLDADIFSHTGANGNSPTDRMIAAGYVFSGSWSNGENIAQAGTTAPSINLTDYAVMEHGNLFKSPGHRENILNTSFREVGVGQKQGNFTDSGTTFLSSMLTEDFAHSGNHYFLTGVIYTDNNSNQFYDVGEGLAGVIININGKFYPVATNGSYSISLANGTYNVTITGNTLANPVNYSVQINNGNVKLDVIKNGTAVTVSTWQ